MDFHFRGQNSIGKNYNTVNYSRSASNNSLPSLLKKYLQIRSRQIAIFGQYSVRFSGVLVSELKNLIVRNMYWGRTSFYKTAFHILVIIITFTALSTELSNRIVISTQADSLENLRVSSRTTIDIDLVAQQGSLTPLQILAEETDSVYIEYIVKDGDSLEKIADENGINIDTLRWANDIPSGRDTLTVGQVIKVPKMNGVLYTVKDGDSIDDILGKVELNDSDADKFTFLDLNARYIDGDGNPIPDSVVFIPEAVIPKPAPRQQVTASGPSGGRVVDIDNSGLPAVAPGTFVNPMQKCGGYSFSRGYSSGHTGVDLAANAGCWVVAAGSGTVSRAGWCFSLGYCVVIKHADGYSTVYGHSNGTFGVRAGQQVVAGQQIMQVGCTGYCFGSHLHLSLAANNQDVYSCYYCRINPRGIIPY
jgi:murein DD-endopeptidase MepM/ murein hydrolase activator NlpD